MAPETELSAEMVLTCKTSRERFVEKFAFSWFCFVHYPAKVVFPYPIAAKIGCGLWKYDFFYGGKMSKKDKIEIPDQVGNENRGEIVLYQPEGELDSKVVCANFAHTTPHGAIKGKMQISEVVLYNLDVIISVGYRVKSIAGTRFRQWANHVLKDYMLKGYAIN